MWIILFKVAANVRPSSTQRGRQIIAEVENRLAQRGLQLTTVPKHVALADDPWRMNALLPA